MNQRHFIGGDWVAPADGGRLEVIDPATEQRFATVAAGSAADIDRAVAAARQAFQGPWRQSSGAERALQLRAIAAGIRARLPELARIEVQDNGKPLPEAEWDLGDAAGCFDYYAGLAEALDARQREPVALPDARFRCTVRHEPVGVAGAIIPWNYPLLMAAWKVAPALAAGCTMVLKPSELTPLTALELGRIAAETGLPPGVLNIVTGTGADAGRPLSQHPCIDKIAFTGSVPTGKAVMAAAAQAIKNVSLELGGKSPFIIFADSDLEAAVEWIMFGIFWNQGQVCSATSRVLVEAPLYDRLVERLVVESRRIRIGSGLTPGVKLGPLISAAQHRKVLDIVAGATADGARRLAGGGRPEGMDRGYFLQPTIFDRVPESCPLWRDEVFGPVLALRPFTTEAEALRLANDSRYGLAAAVMSVDEARAERVAATLDAGIVWINCSQPTFNEAPWGGVKESGIGRELGIWGLENYLAPKQITRYIADEPWGWYLGG